MIMTEETGKRDKEQATLKQPGRSTRIGEAVGAGAFGGAVVGFAAHYLSGGKMTFPIFIIAYILILSGLKGWGKLIGLVVFSAVASLLMVVFENLGID
jgi:hypothetical protein